MLNFSDFSVSRFCLISGSNYFVFLPSNVVSYCLLVSILVMVLLIELDCIVVFVIIIIILNFA